MQNQFLIDKKRATGFTLSDTLICLGILGICCALFIPKLIHAYNLQLQKAVTKETFATLYKTVQLGMATKELVPQTSPAFFISRINAIKVCRINASTEGCWNTAIQGDLGDPYNATQAGVILASGATIVGFDTGNDQGSGVWREGLYFDWNGEAGPNQRGEDQMIIAICFGSSPCPISSGPSILPGVISANGSQSIQLYKKLFQ